MTRYPMQPPDDDQALTAFLKQYRPVAPEPTPGLEARLMQAITAQHRLDQIPRVRWLTRVVPAAIAAITLAGWATYRLLTPPALTPQEVAELESFIEKSWTDSVQPTHDSVAMNF
ncbi:MAG: hypothetical protein NZ772_08040 [Cyanobacteria bacterium]|nr:hypothetical protein [Cyanobacteriota bacterium]MDW8201433.1 hypothetical protein [Cyanobacteriota bacterium SKYGB_h_bin112]